MVEKKTWNEFRESGMLWWMNMILHTFGWSIVLEFDKDTKDFISAYPARVDFRGFPEELNDKGYKNVAEYLFKNAAELKKEAQELDKP